MVCFFLCLVASVDNASVAAAAVVVGAAKNISFILLVGSHFRAHRHLCVVLARRRSTVGASTLAKSVSTPAEFELQSQLDSESQSEMESKTQLPEQPVAVACARG